MKSILRHSLLRKSFYYHLWTDETVNHKSRNKISKTELYMRTIFSLLFCFLLFSAYAQSVITGQISDKTDGYGIPGVTIQIKGTTKGTVTDFDGKYQIQASEGDILIISSVGYISQEVSVQAASTIDVSLSPDIQQLEEVVVIGYGKVEEKDVTGVVNKVDSKLFNGGVVASPDALINGKVAGVNMTSSGGEPGAQINIRIRGGTSLSASNQPLFVIDGVPIDSEPNNPDGLGGSRNPLNFINPNDIADITVLKDASAAAIYGSRGANGVIIITTKTGTSGKPSFTYDGNFTVTTFDNPNKFLNRNDFVLTVERRAPGKVDELGNSNTDWVDEVTRVAQGMNHNLSASFGSKNGEYRISTNYQKLDGVLETSSTERIAASLNATQRLLNDDLTLTFNSKHSINNDRFAPGVINTAFSFDPTQPIRVEDPTFGGYFEHENLLAPVNPVSRINQTFDLGRSSRNLIAVKVDYKIPSVEGLSINSQTSLDLVKGKRQLWQPETLKSNANPNGQFLYEDDESTSRLGEIYLNYSKSLNSTELSMDFTAGYSYQDWEKFRPRRELMDEVQATSLGIDSEKIVSDGQLSDINASLNRINSETDTLENRLISGWGRANFSFQDKYLFTTTIRRDGSTRFGQSNRWGNFPSLAVGWRVMEESFTSFLKPHFSDLKFRFSWGITGSQEIPDYLWSTTYAFSQVGAQVIFGDEVISTLRPTAVDPNIKWEETTSSNLGVDFGILEGKIYGSIDLYEKTTDDLIMEISIPGWIDNR